MLDYLISVGGFSVLALAATSWLIARPHAAAPRRWLAAIVILYTAASIRAFPWVLSRPLILGFHQFTAKDVPADRTAIVLLGSGGFTVHGADGLLGVLDLAGARTTRDESITSSWSRRTSTCADRWPRSAQRGCRPCPRSRPIR